jgi:hypothetical protein
MVMSMAVTLAAARGSARFDSRSVWSPVSRGAAPRRVCWSPARSCHVAPEVSSAAGVPPHSASAPARRLGRLYELTKLASAVAEALGYSPKVIERSLLVLLEHVPLPVEMHSTRQLASVRQDPRIRPANSRFASSSDVFQRGAA